MLMNRWNAVASKKLSSARSELSSVWIPRHLEYLFSRTYGKPTRTSLRFVRLFGIRYTGYRNKPCCLPKDGVPFPEHLQWITAVRTPPFSSLTTCEKRLSLTTLSLRTAICQSLELPDDRGQKTRTGEKCTSLFP